jgi:hypothetical protein
LSFKLVVRAAPRATQANNTTADRQLHSWSCEAHRESPAGHQATGCLRCHRAEPAGRLLSKASTAGRRRRLQSCQSSSRTSTSKHCPLCTAKSLGTLSNGGPAPALNQPWASPNTPAATAGTSPPAQASRRQAQQHADAQLQLQQHRRRRARRQRATALPAIYSSRPTLAPDRQVGAAASNGWRARACQPTRQGRADAWAALVHTLAGCWPVCARLAGGRWPVAARSPWLPPRCPGWSLAGPLARRPSLAALSSPATSPAPPPSSLGRFHSPATTLCSLGLLLQAALALHRAAARSRCSTRNVPVSPPIAGNS